MRPEGVEAPAVQPTAGRITAPSNSNLKVNWASHPSRDSVLAHYAEKMGHPPRGEEITERAEAMAGTVEIHDLPASALLRMPDESVG